MKNRIVPSRRTFLKQVSVAAGAGLLVRPPGGRLWTSTWGDPPVEIDDALLRELALKAVDAARAAGAAFADVRLVFGKGEGMGCGYTGPIGEATPQGPPSVYPPTKGSGISYGVRALVDGAWGSAAGYELAPDAVVDAARLAVMVARGNRPRHPRDLELAPVPQVPSGRWETPIVRDPFTVSLKEQGELMLAVMREAAAHPEVGSGYMVFTWQRAIKVFASTEGSVITQRVCDALTQGSIEARVDNTWGRSEIEALQTGGMGYEAIGDTTALIASGKQATAEAIELARATKSAVPAEVGRYDLVLGPRVMAHTIADTLASALNLDRVLGYRANREGTSFAAPPADMLQAYQVASKLVTLRADRAAPGGTATVGWDDEGVRPEPYELVRDGVIVDYLTNRATAAELAPIYRQHGRPVGSRGCAVATPDQRPAITIPNLTLAPSQEATTLEDLIADTKRGYYVMMAYGRPDQQVLNTQYSAAGQHVREIKNGKLGGYVKQFAMQFVTPQLWRSLDGLGGATTQRREVTYVEDPMTQRVTLRVVPARFRQVNVLNVGRKA